MDAQAWCAAIESITTSVALIVGGIWTYRRFIRTRPERARASFALAASHLQISADAQLLRVELLITNSGSVLLPVRTLTAYVQQMLPLPSPVAAEVQERRNNPVIAEREIRWPTLQESDAAFDEGEFQIEPTETDRVRYDFVIPASVTTVLIYAHMENHGASAHAIGWSASTVYDLSSQAEARSEDVDTASRSERHGDPVAGPPTGPKQMPVKPRPQPVRPTPEQAPPKPRPTPMPSPTPSPRPTPMPQQPAKPRPPRVKPK